MGMREDKNFDIVFCHDATRHHARTTCNKNFNREKKKKKRKEGEENRVQSRSKKFDLDLSMRSWSLGFRRVQTRVKIATHDDFTRNRYFSSEYNPRVFTPPPPPPPPLTSDAIVRIVPRRQRGTYKSSLDCARGGCYGDRPPPPPPPPPNVGGGLRPRV